VGEEKKHREMASRKQWLLSGCVAFTTLISTAAVAGPIENYSPVTQARLENPEPGNWMQAGMIQ
jgi:alcohol dehydrogenase (cytochrome c)